MIIQRMGWEMAVMRSFGGISAEKPKLKYHRVHQSSKCLHRALNLLKRHSIHMGPVCGDGEPLTLPMRGVDIHPEDPVLSSRILSPRNGYMTDPVHFCHG